MFHSVSTKTQTRPKGPLHWSHLGQHRFVAVWAGEEEAVGGGGVGEGAERVVGEGGVEEGKEVVVVFGWWGRGRWGGGYSANRTRTIDDHNRLIPLILAPAFISC